MHNKILLGFFATVAGLLVIAAVGLVFMNSRKTTPLAISPSATPSPLPLVACTADAKMCPDGSAVGRVGPNCEFAPCPTVAVAPSGAAGKKAPGDGYELVIDDMGTSSGLEERKTQVMFTQAELETLWNQIYSGTEPAPALPVVDFKKNAVIAAFGGMQSTGGFTMNVASVKDLPASTLVSFVLSGPGEGCLADSVITKPYMIIQVPNTGKQFNVEILNELTPC